MTTLQVRLDLEGESEEDPRLIQKPNIFKIRRNHSLSLIISPPGC